MENTGSSTLANKETNKMDTNVENGNADVLANGYDSNKDLQLKSSKSIDGDIYVYEQPKAPDGGWGWIIVLACFILQGMIDGLFSVFGVFFPQFLDYFGSSRGKTAIIGSLLSSLMMFLGPFVSVLVGLIGCRKVAIIGGVFITMGMLLSVLAPSMEVLIITFGVFGGIGLGFIFQPAVVCVGFWFESKRAVAMGISSSGAGFGMLILASFSGTLLEYFDWKNSLVMVACVTIQCIVCGALLQPVPYGRSKKLESVELKNDDDKDRHQTKLKDSVGNIQYETNNTDYIVDKRLDDILGEERIRSLSTSSYDRALQKKSSKKTNIVEHRIKNDGTDNTYMKPLLHKPHLQHEVYLSQQELPNHSKDHHNSHSVHHIHTSNPMLRKDIYYSGSLRNISNQENASNLHITSVTSKLAHVENDEKTQGTCCQKDYFTPMKEMMSLHILFDMSFIVIAVANALMQAGFVICVYFITDFGISLGIAPEIAAYGVSMYGIGTTIGRASAGVLATLPRVKPVYVTAVSLIISGIVVIVTVLLCKSFIPLAICVALIGFFVAPIIPLTSVMIVDFLGIDHLTNGHGMVSLAKGISSLFSAPLAGFLQDTTGSYIAPFCLTGVLFIISGLLHFLLPFLSKGR